jgi:hypothetical protein
MKTPDSEQRVNADRFLGKSNSESARLAVDYYKQNPLYSDALTDAFQSEIAGLLERIAAKYGGSIKNDLVAEELIYNLDIEENEMNLKKVNPSHPEHDGTDLKETIIPNLGKMLRIRGGARLARQVYTLSFAIAQTGKAAEVILAAKSASKKSTPGPAPAKIFGKDRL